MPPALKKVFALVDCNNFHASCERLFRPELNEKLVVVLSNNDGCIVARSNKAKAHGIPMGAPLFKMKYLIAKHGIHGFSSNNALSSSTLCAMAGKYNSKPYQRLFLGWVS